ncbi:LOW QUALITY PROTEIN: rho GTPase-activating protein SYDE1 [Xyrichtys novacula]|uniref:Rho GTPase-activating protein SYDE1 n=1 Tax=Xyrichtys novacula TaxID=13765 RepID=A0AAV1HAQ4_XYRNO|nr:LOW QUALITY PROTEIN: rho GTPase-activating protein SYDE1 [Xyrichtys novacula]
MAEPLLKRTFSRLRGRDRSRRKTDPKLSDVPVNSDSASKSSSSPSTPLLTPLTALSEPSPSSPPTNHITVAKKQQWARQASLSRTTYPPPSPAHRPLDQGQPSLTSQDASVQGWSQRLAQEKLDRICISLDWDMTRPSCVPVGPTSVHHEVSKPAGGSSEFPLPSSSTKSSQRAYLQSLERSSRAWVLSSGKTQASDQACGPQEESGRNIWYNPIPEEEDGGGACRGEDKGEEIWRRREEREERGEGAVTKRGGESRSEVGGDWAGSAEKDGGHCPPEGAIQTVNHHIDDIETESSDPPPSDSHKKGGVSSSVIDRLRSPGTVRRLSLKMKKLPELRRKLSLRSSSRAHRQGNDAKGEGEESTCKTASSSALSDQNVISRYHLDSSTPPARPLRRSSRRRSSNKGGYLSDGDSPELLPRQQAPPITSPQETCDVSSFQMYVGSEPPRCSQRVTGLLTVHLLGLEEMKTCRSEVSKDIFLAIQIDGVTRARTALLPLRSPTLSLNHAFNLELERARQLRIVVLTPVSPQTVGGAKPGADQTSGGQCRNRVCGLGGVSIPPLFKGSRCQQLCVKLEPRGLLYFKLSLQEKWDTQPSSDSSGPANVFGVELHHLVEKERSARPVPLLIQKTVAEIERRGLKVVGLYRLCGSAAVKKELRDWFERDSSVVSLSEDLYPDINVITGILKDYLRELPSQLITQTLYQVVRDAMMLKPPPPPPVTPDPQLALRTVELLSCLPPPERATLSLLLDHLSLVASFSSYNRMTHQNLAVCFGPVLLTPTQEAWRAGGGGGGGRGGRGGVKGPCEEIASAVDFKRHIEALHYLLQLWPVPTDRVPAGEHFDTSPPASPALTHHPPRRPALRLALPQSPEEEVVVSRRGRGGLSRLESPPPINRYAGDWSVCGRDLLSRHEADYDEVAGSDSEGGSGEEEDEEKKGVWSGGAAGGLYVDDFLDFDAPFNCRLSLKDFDTLIHDLDRELAKHINICL